jgi:quinohemoprotein ethanol dehydrogenase
VQFGGLVFDIDKWNVVSALDAKTGLLLWKFELVITRSRIKMACCDIAQSIALYAGKVILATLDQRLIALDAATGQKIWEVTMCDQLSGSGSAKAANQSFPICIVKRGVCSCSKQSCVTAYSIKTGVKMWRYYSTLTKSVGENIEGVLVHPADTWKGAWWKHGGNGATRDSMAFDPSQNVLYVYHHGFSITQNLDDANRGTAD